jgi:DNA-binding MarR family transcriptional regulator
MGEGLKRGGGGRSPDQARSELNAALRARRPELEQAILARVYGIADPSAVAGREYLDGLRQAVAAGVDLGIAVIESGRERRQTPPELLVQARLAARHGVSVDTVLRRYYGGNALFTDVLVEEAERAELPRTELKRLLRALAASFEPILAVVSEEYARELEGRLDTSAQRHAEQVERLLAGELIDPSTLNYDFEAHHLALAASGAAASQALRALGEKLDRRLLLVGPERGERAAWAWLGGRRRFDSRELDSLASFSWPEGMAIACGEPAQGLSGWRLSHRQALAALPLAQRRPGSPVPYPDVALVASALQDDLLVTSLRRRYLAPLEAHRDGGLAAKETLRAYFAASGNVSSASAALGVSRTTVRARLDAMEESFGRPLDAASAEIEVALRLDEAERGVG